MLISLICPTFGRIESLEETIYSILSQTYKNIELIIVNDNNKIILEFHHPNVKIFNLENRFESLGEKRNFCVDVSSGNIIVPVDDDDIILPDYISCIIKKIENFDWYLPMNTFIFNKDLNKLKVSGHLLPNLLSFNKKIWEKYKFPHVSFDENGAFFKIISKHSKGRLAKLDLKNIHSVCGWQESMSGSYHTQKMYRADAVNFYENIKNRIEMDLQNYKIPSGLVKLKPKFKRDYLKLKEEFISIYGK